MWSYPSGEILFQKNLNEWVNRIEWNPFMPNVFAAFLNSNVSCFFISNLFPRVKTHVMWSPPVSAKYSTQNCQVQHVIDMFRTTTFCNSIFKLNMISRRFSSIIFVWPQSESVHVIHHIYENQLCPRGVAMAEWRHFLVNPSPYICISPFPKVRYDLLMWTLPLLIISSLNMATPLPPI